MYTNKYPHTIKVYKNKHTHTQTQNTNRWIYSHTQRYKHKYIHTYINTFNNRHTHTYTNTYWNIEKERKRKIDTNAHTPIQNQTFKWRDKKRKTLIFKKLIFANICTKYYIHIVMKCECYRSISVSQQYPTIHLL